MFCFTAIILILSELSVFKMGFLTQNPCLLRGLLEDTWLMHKRYDHMACLSSILIMHSCFFFVLLTRQLL